MATADIEAYGVERWLAELALALRQETYRPEPISLYFLPGIARGLAIAAQSAIRTVMQRTDQP
jgi:hypothetical protein